jgi:hypothetical protein
MAKSTKRPIIELPVIITLTSDGVDWLRRNNRQPRRVRTADSRLEYGIALRNFSATSLQKMINIDYISAVEIARTEYSEKRREIIDLTKLIVYRILYRSFEEETYTLLMQSSMIRRWNRTHPTRIIDETSIFNYSQMESIFASCSGELPSVSEDIQSAVIREIDTDPKLGMEEKEIHRLLCGQFVSSMRNITWCVLARSRSQQEYPAMVHRVGALLRGYISRAKIAEYLALMVTELLTYTESLRSLGVARRLSPRSKLGPEMLRSPKLREAIAEHLRKEADYLYLTYRVMSKAASIGTGNRLRIVLFNRAEEYRKVKAQIEDKLALDIKKKSLLEFYRTMPEGEVGVELGLYYLSFLQAECARCDVHLESYVSEVPARDLMVISLQLQF